MAKPIRNNELDSGNCFRFNLAGLIVFSLCLMGGAALISAKIFTGHSKIPAFDDNTGAPDGRDKDITDHVGPWGELLTQNIRLERPAELIPKEITNPGTETWVFRGLNVVQVKSLFAANGLTRDEAEKALSPDRVIPQGNDTVFKPGDDFVFSLSPDKRQKLYGALYGKGVNTYLDYPYIFPKESIESVYADPRLNPDDVALLKKLVYANHNAMQLSDNEVLFGNIPTVSRRVAMGQALSRQSAVLVGLCIRPDTDIDKIASYWGRMANVHFDDIRPIMQALKELPNGGRVNLMFLLPPFAREHLYTFPVQGADDKTTMDCHWSTFNFSSVEPDNRFNDPDYAVQYIKNNYYQIDAPGIYGDVILLINDKQEIKHSAVYLADDLVFTKYGDNNSQPWMIVRISDMQEQYPTLKPFYFRQKTD